MAKDRIERDELASKLMETAATAEDPSRAMAELLTDFVMEAEVTAKIGADPHERSEQRPRTGTGIVRGAGTRGWGRCRCPNCARARAKRREAGDFDAHKGLMVAVRKVLKAEWQRCKVHFYRNVLVHVPKRSQAEVSEARKAVFVQRDEKSAKAKAADLVRQFQARFAKAMEIFEAGIDDVLSYLHYPQSHRVRISSTNPLERLNQEIRRRNRVVGIFPNGAAYLRLIGMLLVEKNDDWLTDDKKYRTLDEAPAEESASKVVSMAAAQ